MAVTYAYVRAYVQFICSATETERLGILGSLERTFPGMRAKSVPGADHDSGILTCNLERVPETPSGHSIDWEELVEEVKAHLDRCVRRPTIRFVSVKHCPSGTCSNDRPSPVPA